MPSHSLTCLLLVLAVMTPAGAMSIQNDVDGDQFALVVTGSGGDVITGDIRPYTPSMPSTGLALPSVTTMERYQEIELHEPMPAESLPSSIDLSEDPCFPAVGNQGGQGSCSAWAVTYYAYGFLEAKDQNWVDASTGNPEHLMSPAWTYNMVSPGLDHGSWMWDVALVLKDWGGATLASMPYNDTDVISWGGPEAFRECSEHRVEEVVRMEYDGSTVDQLKALLVAGVPVTFTLDSYQFHNFGGDFVLSSTEYDSSSMDHSQTLVGYDDAIMDDEDTGAFKVVNSWGDGWGDSGYYWITYETIEEIGASENLNLCYVTDKLDYRPEWLVHWSFSDLVSRDAAISIRTETGEKSPHFNDSASTLSFPEHMWCDVTEIADGANTVQLTIGTSAGTGILASMDIEWYWIGFQPGMVDAMSSSSSEMPSITPVTVSASIPRDATTLTVAAGMAFGELNTEGDSGWCVEADENGIWSDVRSGTVADGERSVLTMQLNGPAILSFNWMLEAASSDILSIQVDGDTELTLSGQTSWTFVSMDIGAGQHTVSWVMTKKGPPTMAEVGRVANIGFSSPAIKVIGDEQLEQMRQEWSLLGTGDADDPIIFDGMVFDAEGPTDAVNLADITKAIVFQNCAMVGAGGGKAGITTVNCSQIVLERCTISDNDRSIGGDEGAVTISNCTVGSNGEGPGVYLPGATTNVTELTFDVEPLYPVHEAWAKIDAGLWQEISDTIPLEGDGHHVVSLDIEDERGNHYLDEGDILLDTVPPSVIVVGVDDGQHLSTPNVELILEVEDGGSGMASTQYSTDGEGWLDCGNDLSIEMIEGEHTIEVRVIDLAGNVNATRMVLVIDLTDPELEAQASVRNGMLFMTIEAMDDRGEVEVSLSIDQGVWFGSLDQVDVADLEEGGHDVTVRAVDEAGNTAMVTLPFDLDLTAPELVSYAPSGTGASTGDLVSMTFDEAIDYETATILVSVNGEEVAGSVTFNGSGTSLSFQPQGGWAPDTVYDVSVSVEDLQGNELDVQWSFTTAQDPLPWGVLAMTVLAVGVLILLAWRRVR